MKRVALNALMDANGLLPIGAPAGEYWIEEFPSDMPPGSSFNVTISDVQKRLINFDADTLGPIKKQKGASKIPRSTQLEFEFFTKVRPIRMFIKTDGKLVFVFGVIDSPIVLAPQILIPAQSSLITFYEGTGRRKILHGYNQGSGHPVLDINRALEQYVEFFSIDTNCWDIKELGRISATVAIQANARLITDKTCYFSGEKTYHSFAINPEGNPELHGIRQLLVHLEEKFPGKAGERVGIITDTEYGLVKLMNQRKIPVCENYFLPEAFDLIYATADAGPDEYMVNRLMKKCDKLASEALKDFVKQHSLHRA